MKEKILEVKNLEVSFKTYAGISHAVRGIDFNLHKGETLAIVGESGCGKTVSSKAIMRLLPESNTIIGENSEVLFHGEDLLKKSENEMVSIRGSKISMIFQDPMACLNPRKKVIDIIAQGLDIHHDYKDEKEREEKVYKILEMVGLSKEHANRFPHQFSGGQRQRIGIARALIMNPDLIIADEAISALDVSIQAQVVNLMKKMQKETGAAYLFIAHDLSMVKYISDRIGVLHLGHLVETGTADEIFSNPLHPYTRSLLSAIPHSNPRVEKVRKSFSYDYETSGLDYAAGTQHQITDTHFVLGTDEDVEQFKKDAANFKL